MTCHVRDRLSYACKFTDETFYIKKKNNFNLLGFIKPFLF